MLTPLSETGNWLVIVHGDWSHRRRRGLPGILLYWKARLQSGLKHDRLADEDLIYGSMKWTWIWIRSSRLCISILGFLIGPAFFTSRCEKCFASLCTLKENSFHYRTISGVEAYFRGEKRWCWNKVGLPSNGDRLWNKCSQGTMGLRWLLSRIHRLDTKCREDVGMRKS